MGNLVRWTPYAHSFHGIKSEGCENDKYVSTLRPTDMMQSQPTASMHTCRDENAFISCKPHITLESNVRTDMENGEINENLSPNSLQVQINQHHDWMQGNFLMSTGRRFVNPSMSFLRTPPLWRTAVPPDVSSNDYGVPCKIDDFMNSYILRSLSPQKGSKSEESPMKPTKRSHECSDEMRANVVSSPLRMYVRPNEDENVKDGKGKRIFSRQRRGRHNAGSNSDWQARDGRRQYKDMKKSRSSEQTESYDTSLQPTMLDGGMASSRDSSPPPSVRMICGKRVTMIDFERKIFIIDLLSSDDCDNIRKMTDDYVRGVHENHSGAVTWRTLYTYTKQDLPCGEVPGLTARFTNPIMADVIKIVGEVYCQPKEAVKLRPRSWKEPHLLLYQRIENKPIHTGVEMHYDGMNYYFSALFHYT